MESDDHSKKIQVFYDGQCPMCTVLVDTLDHSSRKREFDLRDMHTVGQLPFEKSALEKEIHVIGRDGKTYKGAEAILMILEQYTKLRMLAQVGRLPFVKPFLPFGYGLVSRNRRFLFGPASRVFWLKVSVTIAFVTGLALSLNLWLSSRSYPLSPVISGLLDITHPFDWMILGSLFLLAAAVLVSSKPQKFIWGFVATVFFLCFFDQTRWQPWVFQYSFLLVILALFSWKSDDAIGRTRALNSARLIIASTYIFSGLQKINLNFMEIVFPWLVRPITDIFPALAEPLYAFGVIAPFVQVAFGIGLLTKQYRRLSVALAVSMHVFILAMIGPFGLNWNSIVWPWTSAMVVFDLLLFTGKADFSFRDVVWTKNYPFHALVLLLFGILPFLSFVNAWDSYLSSALYSGNTTDGAIYLSAAGRADLPDNVRAYVTAVAPNNNKLDIQRWALSELNVPPYPETRVFKRIARVVCNDMNDPSQMMLFMHEQRLVGNSPQTLYRCSDL